MPLDRSLNQEDGVDLQAESLDKSLHLLAVATQRVEIVASSCFVTLVMTIVFSSLPVFRKLYFPIYIGPNTTFFVSCSLLLLQVGLLVSYQKAYKAGEIIFSEVSDELQWHLEKISRQQQSNYDLKRNITDGPQPGRPSISMRIALRTFLNKTDLPLTNGSSGVPVYLVLTFVLWAVAMAGVLSLN